jgi:hypothetical protein
VWIAPVTAQLMMTFRDFRLAAFMVCPPLSGLLLRAG